VLVEQHAVQRPRHRRQTFVGLVNPCAGSPHVGPPPPRPIAQRGAVSAHGRALISERSSHHGDDAEHVPLSMAEPSSGLHVKLNANLRPMTRSTNQRMTARAIVTAADGSGRFNNSRAGRIGHIAYNMQHRRGSCRTSSVWSCISCQPQLSTIGRWPMCRASYPFGQCSIGADGVDGRDGFGTA
jgi:hypothetical protein